MQRAASYVNPERIRAKQFKRHYQQLRLLRTRLGRLIRDIHRKIADHAELEAASSASRPRSSPPMPAPGEASSYSMPRRCRATRMTTTRSLPSSMPPRSSPAARSSAPMSTRATAATARPIRTASSSPVRSAASSGSSSANCAAVRPSKPSLATAPRPLLPQGPRGRRRQRHPHRCRLQPPPRSRLAEQSAALPGHNLATHGN